MDPTPHAAPYLQLGSGPDSSLLGFDLVIRCPLTAEARKYKGSLGSLS